MYQSIDEHIRLRLLLDANTGHLQRVFKYKKKCLHISEHPEGLGEDGPMMCMDQSLEQKGDTLTVRIQSSDSMSFIRTRSQKGQVSKAEMAQESRSEMVVKWY